MENIAKLFGLTELTTVGVRMKQIAAASVDSLLLADGPPHPDYRLLDLCGDALHYAKMADRAYAARDDNCPHWDSPKRAAWDANDRALMDEWERNKNEVVQRLRRARKLKATTPAGIYAKALLVRCSKTGAIELAASLAADLVDCEGLRETLWANEVVQAGAAA